MPGDEVPARIRGHRAAKLRSHTGVWITRQGADSLYGPGSAGDVGRVAAHVERLRRAIGRPDQSAFLLEPRPEHDAPAR